MSGLPLVTSGCEALMGGNGGAPQFGAEWLKRFRTGDERAFEALFRAFYAGLVALVIRYVGSQSVAEDLVQELFLTLWQRRRTLELTQSVSNYLHVAARNRALAYLRHEKVVERHAAAVVGQFENSARGDAELLMILELQEAIEQLPARCKQVFCLSRQQGMTNSEIATALEISIKTVKNHMTHAFTVLRDRVDRD